MLLVKAHDGIDSFIDTLDDGTATRVDKLISALAIHGHTLRMPHSRALGSGLFELRYKGDHPVRIIYMFHRDTAVLLHVFSKKSGKLPLAELRYAQAIKKAYLQ